MTKAMKKEILKLNKIPHPRSRKTAQLTKKAIRNTARDNKKKHNLVKKSLVADKYMWFKENLDSTAEFSPSKFLELIEKYLSRFDRELEQIRIKHSIKHRKGRQHASREDIINMTKKNEAEEFNGCGMEVPDLLDPEQLWLLRRWTGDANYLPNLKMARYYRAKLLGLIEKGDEKVDVGSDADEEEGEEEDEEEEDRDSSAGDEDAEMNAE